MAIFPSLDLTVAAAAICSVFWASLIHLRLRWERQASVRSARGVVSADPVWGPLAHPLALLLLFHRATGDPPPSLWGLPMSPHSGAYVILLNAFLVLVGFTL